MLIDKSRTAKNKKSCPQLRTADTYYGHPLLAMSYRSRTNQLMRMQLEMGFRFA